MLNYKQWLSEAYKFKKAKDTDYTSDPDKIVFLSADDKSQYVEQGQTHGNVSHAIKHYVEFDEKRYKKIATKVKDKIKELVKSKDITYLELYTKGQESVTDIQQVIEKANWKAFLNTLDLINDKKERGTKLSDIEKQLIPFMNELSSAYMAEINKIISGAVNLDELDDSQEILDKIKTSHTIKLSAIDRMGYRIYFIDLKDNIFIIADEKYIYTCFEFTDSASSYKSVLKNFWNKKKSVKFTNEKVKQVISGVVENV